MKYSFIVPIYNGDSYIDKCLASLLNQTYKKFEIIVINDGSTDDSLNILKAYSKKHKQIKLYSTENKGVSSARNYGLEKVTGDYAIFVDIDDYVDVEMLYFIESKILNNKSIDLVKYGYLCVGNDDNKIINSDEEDKSTIIEGSKAFVKLVGDKVPFDLTCIYAFKISFWKKHEFKFELDRYHEDFGLIPYVIMKANKILLVDKVMYYYVQSENSITRNSDYQKQLKKFNDILYHFDNLFEKIEKDKTIELNDKKIFYSYISNAVLLRYMALNKKDRLSFKNEMKRRNIVDLLLNDTFLRKLKKIIYKMVL